MRDKATVNSLARHGASLFTSDDLWGDNYGRFYGALLNRDEWLALEVGEKVREHLHRRVEEAGRRLDRAVVRRMDWPDTLNEIP